jgi:hypothetical protein
VEDGTIAPRAPFVERRWSLHIFYQHVITHRVWSLVAEWTRQSDLKPIEWPHIQNQCCTGGKNISSIPDCPRKAIRSITLLTIWEIWKKSNDRIFNRKESVVAKIRGVHSDRHGNERPCGPLSENVNTDVVVWTSLGPLPRWVPGPTTRWAPGTTRLALHDT